MPGCSASNPLPSSLNESVSEAAASTVRFPVKAGWVVAVEAVAAVEGRGFSLAQPAPRPNTMAIASARPGARRRGMTGNSFLP